MNTEELIHLLNTDALLKYNTKIVGGFCEPFYKAHSGCDFAEIQFSHDYIRSALHELSHWCVAGASRRKLDDFGYWYAEDGRNQQQQNEFFKVEVKPQAIEWALSIICGIKFEASIDNLNADGIEGVEVFQENLEKQLSDFLVNGFARRTQKILKLLAESQQIYSIVDYIVADRERNRDEGKSGFEQ